MTVERDDDGRPIHDGFLDVLTKLPLDPLANPALRESYHVVFPFRKMRSWKPADSGLAVVDLESDYTEVIPWNNVLSYRIQHNSEEYREAMDQWVLKCLHDITKPEELAPEDKPWCKKCMYTVDAILELQELFDKKMRDELEQS